MVLPDAYAASPQGLPVKIQRALRHETDREYECTCKSDDEMPPTEMDSELCGTRRRIVTHVAKHPDTCTCIFCRSDD